MSAHELAVLVDQLDELLASGVDDPDDALEIAAIAGMIARLDPRQPALEAADAWRTGPGAAVLDEAWDEADVDALVEAIEVCALENATEAEVEEALLDFDELVAAAVWCGRTDVVAPAVPDVERSIRLVPEVFAPFATDGRELARLPTVAAHLEVWSFWLAVADAGDAVE